MGCILGLVPEDANRAVEQINDALQPFLSAMEDCARIMSGAKIPKKWKHYAAHAKKSRTRKKYRGKIEKAQLDAFLAYWGART